MIPSKCRDLVSNSLYFYSLHFVTLFKVNLSIIRIIFYKDPKNSNIVLRRGPFDFVLSQYL